MAVRFYRPKPPSVPRAKVPDLSLMVLGVPLTLLALGVTMRIPGVLIPPHILILIPIFGLYAADHVLAFRAQKFADELYEFLNDVGDVVSSGFGVEQALHMIVERRGGPVAKEFKHALDLAADRPLDIALIDAATELGNDTFTETAELLSMMVQSDGEVGSAIKNLGRRLTKSRRAERENERALVGGIALLLIVGGFLAPAMASFMANAADGATENEYPMTDWAYRFYALVALGNAFVQFTVFGSLRRMLARQPAYMLSTYMVLVVAQWALGKITFEEMGLF